MWEQIEMLEHHASPLDRPATLVPADALDRKEWPEAAHEAHGAVIDGTGKLDELATGAFVPLAYRM